MNGKRFGWGSKSCLALIALTLLSAALSSGMSGTCNPCGPDAPFLDPVTSQCTTSPTIGGTVLGPALPGSGNLPSEPGTPAPTTQPDPDLDPDSVDQNVWGLGGRWLDSGREICIQQTPFSVTATYYVEYECHHNDGTDLVDRSHTDFVAQLTDNVLRGSTNVCSQGNMDPSLNGLFGVDLTLVVSANGKKLVGIWLDPINGTNVPVTITRQTVGDCSAP